MADGVGSGQSTCGSKPRLPAFTKWSDTFLVHLAATSNVTAAALRAKISTSAAYEAKRQNPEFNRAWRHALCEGYELLELELLRRLRQGELKPAAGAKRGVRAFDNATAFRLLSAHREEAAKQRAVRDDQDEAAILSSIDAKLDRMRQRQIEAAAAAKAADA